MNHIDKLTYIPLFSLPFLFGMVWFSANINSRSKKNERDVKEVKEHNKELNGKIFDKLDEMNNNYNGINARLSNIEGQLSNKE